MTRRIRPALSVALLSLMSLCAACASPERHLTLSQIHPLDVDLSYGIRLIDGSGRTCPVIPADTTATVNDVPMKLTDPGNVSQGLLIFNTQCNAPQFQATAEIPRRDEMDVVVGDSTRTLHVVLRIPTQGAQLQLVAPANRELVVGQRATVAWSDPNAHLEAEHLTLQLEDARFRTVELKGADLEVSGSQVSFTVPELQDGDAHLTLYAPYANVVTCEGADHCFDSSTSASLLGGSGDAPVQIHH